MSKQFSNRRLNFEGGGNSPPVGQGLLTHEVSNHTQGRTTAGRTPLDKWSARRRDLHLTTHNTHKTDIHAPGGIRTHNFSKRVAADLRLRPRGGHWDRPAIFSEFKQKRMTSYPSRYLFLSSEHLNLKSGFPLCNSNCYETKLVKIQLRHKNDYQRQSNNRRFDMGRRHKSLKCVI